MKIRIKIIFAVLLCLSITALAQEKGDYSNDPGYANFGDLSAFQKGDDVTEVYIEHNLLQMVARMSAQKDSTLSELLNGLKLVKVNTFKVNGNDSQEIMDRMNKVNKSLMDKGWSRIVRTKSKHNMTNVYIKTSNNSNQIEGLVVTDFGSDKEAAFINIVGKINLETIGRLGNKFNIPSLDKIKHK